MTLPLSQAERPYVITDRILVLLILSFLLRVRFQALAWGFPLGRIFPRNVQQTRSTGPKASQFKVCCFELVLRDATLVDLHWGWNFRQVCRISTNPATEGILVATYL